MKSLKRTLSLVLVLVMVLGLFGVAGAAFTDAEKIQYNEAVDVMTGIGAIEGMGDGTFAPTSNLTRAQAAKMVTYAILGKANTEALGDVPSTFKDVTVAGGFEWAIPSIEYLKNKGIVEGRGNGIYDPNGKVTSYELAKMLLCAIGYGKNNEFSGDNYELDVAVLANKTDLYVGRASTAGKLGSAATREEAALYCFNALTQADAGQVTYSKDTESYSDPKATIGATVYGLDSAEDKDAYGFTGRVWTAPKISDKPITGVIVTDKTVDSFVGPKTLAEVKAAYPATKFNDAITVTTNGKAVTGVTYDAAMAAVPVGAKITFVDSSADTDAKIDTIIIVVEYAGVVGKYDATTKKTPVTFFCETAGAFDPAGVTVQVDGELAFAEKTPVIVVPAGDRGGNTEKFLSITAAKTVEGTVTATAADYFRLDGEKMLVNPNSGLTIAALKATTGKVILALDSYGNAIKTLTAEEVAPAALNYVYVAGFQAKAGTDGKEDLINPVPATAAVAKMSIIGLDGKASVVDYAITSEKQTDGTTKYFYVLANGTKTEITDNKNAVTAGFYSYTVDANGAYTVKDLDSDKAVAVASASALTVTKNSATVAGATGKIASSATVISVFKDGSMTTYTGIANFPTTATYTASDKVFILYTFNAAGVLTNIYVIDNVAATPIPTDATYAIYLGEGETVGTNTAYNFFVNGETVSYYKTNGTLPEVGKACTITLTGGKISDIGTVALTDAKAITLLDPMYFVTEAGLIYYGEKTVVYDMTTPTAPKMGTLAKDAKVQYITAGGNSATTPITFAIIVK